MPLEWFLDSLPLLLASAASYEDYSTATRLKTSEFLQIILTLSTKLDASAIENLSLKWLKSKAEKNAITSMYDGVFVFYLLFSPPPPPHHHYYPPHLPYY